MFLLASGAKKERLPSYTQTVRHRRIDTFAGSHDKKPTVRSQTRERRRGLIATKQGPLRGCDRFARTQARDVRTVFVPRKYRKLGIALAQGVRCLSRRVPRLRGFDEFSRLHNGSGQPPTEKDLLQSFVLAIPKQSERSGFRYFILTYGKLEDRYLASDHRSFGEAGRPNRRSISQTTLCLSCRFCCNEKVTENETTTALVRTPPQISICSEEAVKATEAKVALAVRSE